MLMYVNILFLPCFQDNVSNLEHPTNTVVYLYIYFNCILFISKRYTQSNGRRPFGISALIVGFDYDGTPRLYQTDPSGTYHAWKVKK